MLRTVTRALVAVIFAAATVHTAAGMAIAAPSAENSEDTYLVQVHSPADQNAIRAHNAENGFVVHSPGIAPGNVLKIPVNIPVNLCGNNVTAVGTGNSSSGNTCVSREQ